MTSPVFGLIFQLVDDDPRPPVYGDFSVVGLSLPSDDATESLFPLNKAVDINTGDATTLAHLGTGPLNDTILRINAQLMDLQASARCVVVRVPGKYQDGVVSVTVGVGGTLYNHATVTFDPPAHGGPAAKGVAVIEEGVITAINVTSPGSYDQGEVPDVTIIGDSTGATATAVTQANKGVNFDMDQQMAAIVGSPNDGTGIYALLKAPQDLGVTPRILGAPGFTGLNRFAVVEPPIVTEVGAGYTNATVTFNPLGATGHANIVGGQVVSIDLDTPGNYPEYTEVTITVTGDGTGAEAVCQMERLNNPVCSAIVPVAEALMAHCVVGGPGTTKTEAQQWRQLMTSKRLIPVDNWEIIASMSDIDTQMDKYADGAASTIGLGVRVDFQHGGFPFWAWANQPVQGLLGLKRIDSFSLVDGATDAQELLAWGIGVTVRGSRADASLTNSGFQHISWMNANDDTQWNYYNKTRGRDFIHLALMKSLRQRLGKDNVTLHSVQAVLNDMAAIAADLKSKECVIGWSVGFRASENTALGLRAGHFTVFFDAEQPAPILVITIKSGLLLAALDAELAALSTQLTDITQLQ